VKDLLLKIGATPAWVPHPCEARVERLKATSWSPPWPRIGYWRHTPRCKTGSLEWIQAGPSSTRSRIRLCYSRWRQPGPSNAFAPQELLKAP